MTSTTQPSWLRAIRRQDRWIKDDKQAWEILDRGSVCHVAFCVDGWPYVVPLSYGLVDRALYFHCAREGTKLDLLRANPNVCFEVDTDVETVVGKTACESTVRYRSVIGFGQASIVTDRDERLHGLQALLDRYSASEAVLPLSDSIPDIEVFKIDVASLSGKLSPGPSES